MNPATTPMEVLVSVVTQMTNWFTSTMGSLLQQPLFLVTFSVFIVGACIGLVKRVIS